MGVGRRLEAFFQVNGDVLFFSGGKLAVPDKLLYFGRAASFLAASVLWALDVISECCFCGFGGWWRRSEMFG